MASLEEDIEPNQTAVLHSAPWLRLAHLRERLAEAAYAPEAFRTELKGANTELIERFRADESVEVLVHARAELIDAILREVWRSQLPAGYESWTLAAVGGYGRGELHPHSDVDILILVPETPDDAGRGVVERVVTFLWDINLEVGHSVRTVAQCAEESVADVGVMTTLVEARLLAGNAELLGEMREAVSADRIWPVKAYFEAKVAEQQERHAKANDTAYNLEPNVKTGPGGLRDIQTIAWVAKRHFGASSLDELRTHGFLSLSELRKLKQAQSFLWKVRFGLHILTGRREDRLLFDHQIKLAQGFGYEDASYTLAVEQFMQRYYRTVMDVSLLNELLLQLFREAILTETSPPRPLNPRFQVRNDYLEAVNEELFARTPSALLEIFVLLQQNPEVKGVRASTIRAINKNLWLIDEEFRQNPRNHRLFLEILRAPAGVTHQLRRMNTYGVLGRYIPAFGRIVGRMQYDLFHAYTVDAHTLFVVSNLRRLAIPRFDHELPELSRIMQSLQKQEIGDPEVINAFAQRVGDESHLDYLYMLTCADVRGTNPKLWNSWKASLFHEFYQRVKRALRRGLESPIDQEELVRETQDGARKLLAEQAIGEPDIERAWKRFSATYFLRHTAEEVAWHTRLLAEREDGSEEPLVAIEPHSVRGTTGVLVFGRPRRHGFARATAVLDQLGLTVVDARITPTDDGFSLDLYHVLEDDGAPITDEDRQAEIERALWRSVQRPDDAPPAVSRRAPRQARMFNTPTQIAVSMDERNHRSVLELIAGDRPGLLCDVGKVLMQERVELHAAKIMTVGERAEDV